MKADIISMAGFWNLTDAKVPADTLEELYESLNEVMEEYIETKIENNLSIPIPETPNNSRPAFAYILSNNFR